MMDSQLFLYASSDAMKSPQKIIHVAKVIRQHHVIVFVFIISAFLFSLGNIYDSDEGTILNGAWKMFQGRHLYTDFFSFIAPGSYILTLCSFYLFGPYHFSARILSILLLLISLYAVYTIGILLGNKKVGTFATALWLICSFFSTVVTNHNTLSSYLASITVWLLIVALKKKRSIFFVYSGLILGAVTVFLQTKGIILGLGFFIFLFVYLIRRIITPRQIVLFVISSALLPLSAIWYWGVPLLYRLLIEWPIHHYPAANHVSFIPLLVLLAVSGTLVCGILQRSRKTDKDIITILVITQLCLFLSIINHPDITHILWNSFGILLLISYILHARMEFLSPATHDTVFIDIPLMIILSFSITLAIYSIRLERVFKKTVENLFITSLYAHPFLPEYYFELGVPDPYPYDILVSRMYPPDAFNENLRILAKEKPEYIFLNYGMVSKFDYQKENPLDDYIGNRYHKVGNFSSTLIMKKNEN